MDPNTNPTPVVPVDPMVVPQAPVVDQPVVPAMPVADPMMPTPPVVEPVAPVSTPEPVAEQPTTVPPTV